MSIQGNIVNKIYIFLIFYCYSITVVCIFFSSLHPTPVKPTSLPYLHPPPWFCPCDLYSSSCNPLFSLSPPHSPLPIVRLFLTSMSLVIFCLLFSSVDYVPVKGQIIWYLSLTIWLISLSIMLSSFIHAVAKDISSFFLSAAWIQKLWYIYTMEFYAAERKKELIPFATAWMELESIMLSEISQMVRDKYHMISPLTGT